MASLSEPFDPDQLNQLIVVNRRPAHDLPEYILGDSITRFIRSNITAPGYYIWSNTFQDYDIVEFFDTHWYRIFANKGSYFTCLNDCIKPETESTGYWKITDPQHPQYTAPPQHPPLPFSAAGLSRLSARSKCPRATTRKSSNTKQAQILTVSIGSHRVRSQRTASTTT